MMKVLGHVPVLMTSLTMSFSSIVSMLTASMQCLRQRLRASNQSVLLLSSRVELKKYQWLFIFHCLGPKPTKDTHSPHQCRCGSTTDTMKNKRKRDWRLMQESISGSDSGRPPSLTDEALAFLSSTALTMGLAGPDSCCSIFLTIMGWASCCTSCLTIMGWATCCTSCLTIMKGASGSASGLTIMGLASSCTSCLIIMVTGNSVVVTSLWSSWWWSWWWSAPWTSDRSLARHQTPTNAIHSNITGRDILTETKPNQNTKHKKTIRIGKAADRALSDSQHNQKRKVKVTGDPSDSQRHRQTRHRGAPL